MNSKAKNNLLIRLGAIKRSLSDVEKLIKRNERDGLVSGLSILQEAVIGVGTEIDSREGEGTKTVKDLEIFCEQIWNMSQCENMGKCSSILLDMEKTITMAIRDLKETREHYSVVFFPYKASMWDSLESVYLAAAADPDCDAYVVPIPYYDLVDGVPVKEHYDLEMFPDYIPVINYRDFPLEGHIYDMGFIHNPFDNFNNVTTVHPKFYSKELKNYIDDLTYIPYFVQESMFVVHRELPSYYRCDHIASQNAKFTESFAANIPREKFLELGNPITDKIMKLKKDKPAIPKAWKSMLPNGEDFGGKRAVMFNSSLSMLIKQKERFLNKIEYITETVSKIDGILLIWRPHPLIMSTLERMGQEYLDRFNEIKEKFLLNHCGVYDETPDVGVTVALCDAYLGETGSSLIHNFGIAGKPRFFTDLSLGREKVEDDPLVLCSCENNGFKYFLTDKYDYIFRENLENGVVERFLFLDDIDSMRGISYQNMYAQDGYLILEPLFAISTLIIDLDTKVIRKKAEGNWADSQEIRVSKMDENIGPDGKLTGFHLEKANIPDELIRFIKGEEMGKKNLSYTWYESPDSKLSEFLCFVENATMDQLTGAIGPYALWTNNLDGTCGQKILDALKKGLSEE